MRSWGTRITFELVLGVVVIASLVVILRLSRRIAEDQRRQEADAQALRLLREAWRQKNLQEPPPALAEEAPAGKDRAGMAKKEATIARLDRELAETRATVADLQTQLSAFHDQNAKALASVEDRRQKQQSDSAGPTG